MGLNLSVGYLADLTENDEEGAEAFREDLGRLNKFLAKAGLAAHREPEQCEGFSCDMYGYSGLHYLRRIAAHLDLRGELPIPGGKDASKDPVMDEYYQLATNEKPGFLSRIFGPKARPRTFDHLLLHSDAEGYYLPQDFSSVLFPLESDRIPGGMIGSSQRLLNECKRLADTLQLPLDIDPESEKVWEATDSQGEGETVWERYGVESFTCLRLIAAAEHSIRTGAAIVFC